MRFFTKEDFESDAAMNLTYTSSQSMYEDIQASIVGMEEKKLESKVDNNNNNDQGDTNRPSTSSKSRKSFKDSSEKLVPSFFSRTYVSWVLLTEKMNVFTPVSSFFFSNYHQDIHIYLIGFSCVPLSSTCITNSRNCL